MNVKTPAEIAELNSAALREYAKEIGVKRSATDTKRDLADKVLVRVKELQMEAQEIAAMKAKAKIRTKVESAARAPKAKKTCTQQPCTRKVTENDMCAPHNEEGLWENTHADENHEANVMAMGPSASSKLTEGCWICHPELNEADMEPGKIMNFPSKSKAGMVILAKGTYHHKSQLVKDEIEKAGGEVTKLQTTKNGITVLQAMTAGGIFITAAWTGDAFDYASAAWGDKKYRNVKELVRLLAQA